MKIYDDLHAYDRITVETWAVPEKGASFDRCYQILRDGEVVAEGYSVFGLLNLNTQKLCRAGDVEFHYYTDEPLALSTRFRLPDAERKAIATRPIRYADIDCNGHMNNTNYPDMLCDFIPNIDSIRITDVQIHYVSEAPLGDTLTVYFSEEKTEQGFLYAFETVRRDGTVNVRALIEAEPAEHARGF